MIQLPKNETFPGRVFSRLVIRIGVLILLMGLFEVKGLCQQSTCALQEEIKCCIDEIQPQLCGKVMKNLDERVRMCPICYFINNPILCTLSFA